MYQMFPLHNSGSGDNLTEIPEPARTLHQRFMAISELEPFGPVDAAEILNLEPAQKTLDRLSTFSEAVEETVHTQEVVVGEQRAGDKAQFKFLKSKAGEVGFRYGALRRDRKKDRSVAFDKAGKMVYA